MSESQGLLSRGWSMVAHNKRYIIWFYLLNLLLGLFGTVAFFTQAGTILDHSLLSDRLVRGFDLAVLAEMFARPEFGSMSTSGSAAMYFALLFFVATTLFLPGVLQGYAATYRLPREDFFRACGRNLWRFIRLLIVAGIVMSIAAAILFGIRGGLLKAADNSTNEMLPFYIRMTDTLIIFLVMTVLRIWFDLAQADVVLNDQGAVRKSIGAAFRQTWRGLGQLLGSYVVTTFVAAIVLVVGIYVWMKFVPSESVAGAFIVSQLTLLLLLIPRFWQRGVVVAYHKLHMVEPITVQAFTSVPAIATVTETVIVVPAGQPEETQAS